MDERPRLEEVSAAVDGEAALPADLSAEEAEFHDAALRLRAALRSETPDHPDVRDAVLERIDRPATRRRPTWVAAAAVFVAAALAAGLALRSGGPAAPQLAAADVADQVVRAQRTVSSFDARVRLVERGVHPTVDERHHDGTLRYRAPEGLWLQLTQSDTPPEGWPANDLELLVDDGVVWRRGLVGCPVGSQPECLRTADHVVTDLAPFTEAAVSPLDLVVPVDAFLPVVATDAHEVDDHLVVDTTVARVDRLVQGLRAAGAIRAVHPTDRARIELDAATLTLRRLSISAADNVARSSWAATHGYDEQPGVVVLELDLDVAAGPHAALPAPPADPGARSAGFTDHEDPGVRWTPPSGFTVHRTGRLDSGGPTTSVVALSDGRAWIRVDSTEEWDEPRLFGGLGPLVREIPVGDGVGYTDTAGTKVAVHTAGRDVVVTGSVDTDLLVEVAGTILTGAPIDTSWAQARAPEELPTGALVPRGEHLAALTDGELVIGIPGPGRSGITLTQRPAATLPPPPRADLVETRARGGSARYSPASGTLTWLEDGWVRELAAEGLDLDALRDVAEGLVAP